MKYDPEKSRSSGIVVPLSALRTRPQSRLRRIPRSRRLGELAAAWDFDLIQLLPVNDSGFQTSPYSALSAFALHPLYLSDRRPARARGAAARGHALREQAAADAARLRGSRARSPLRALRSRPSSTSCARICGRVARPRPGLDATSSTPG